MSQKDVGNKVPIYKLKKTDEVMRYYDEWGVNNKYDQDMVDWNYTGPKETSEVFNKNFSSLLRTSVIPINHIFVIFISFSPFVIIFHNFIGFF